MTGTTFTPRPFDGVPGVIWNDDLGAYINVALGIAADGDLVLEDIRDSIRRGDIAATDAGVAQFSQAYDWSYESYGPDYQFLVARHPTEPGRWIVTEGG